MNINHQHAVSYLQELNRQLIDNRHDFDSCEIAVFPPFTDLRSVQLLVSSDDMQISYGAQNVSEFADGAHTGQISAQFLRDLDCRYAIINHSEQRPDINQLTSRGAAEYEKSIVKKLQKTLEAELAPVLCIGDERPPDQIDGVIEKLHCILNDLEAFTGHTILRKSPSVDDLSDVSKTQEKLNIFVAYEPQWAIGSTTCANPQDIGHVATKIKDLADVKVLYGGGVNLSNASAVFNENPLDGLLIGKASLNPLDFASLIKTCCM